MKKRLFYWMTIMLMAFAYVGLAACGSNDDDDNSNSNNSRLVGTWYSTGENEYYSWTETLIFQSNGTGSFSDRYVDQKGGIEKNSYTFNYTILDENNGSGHVYEVITSGDRMGRENVVSFTINGNKLQYNGFGSIFTKQ